MKSMTGFGSGTATKDGITCTVEIKSVNARFLDLFIRSPKQMNPFESTIRGMIQDRITRGKVEVSVSILDAGERPKTFTINSVLRKQIQELLVQEEFYDDSKKVPLQAVNCRRCSIRYCERSYDSSIRCFNSNANCGRSTYQAGFIRSYRYT